MAQPWTCTQVRSPKVHLYVALVLHASLVAIIVKSIGIYAWDDGAITLAFSKTFAETGRIALTAMSEQVEGFSSVAWFLVNALLARLGPNFEQAILLAQVAAGAFLGMALALVWNLSRAAGLRADTTLAILVVLAVFGPTVVEVANGMEMTLLTAAGLALIHAIYFRRNPTIFVLAVAVFLATRFEAMIYYAALLAPLLYQKRYRTFLLLALVGLAIEGVLEIGRMVLFDDFVPNTIHAKRHPPYSSAGLEAVVSHAKGAREAVAALFPLVLGTMAALALSGEARRDALAAWRRPASIPQNVVIFVAPIVAVGLFCTAIGKVWGYTGRMEFLALPCGLLLCGMLFDRYLAAHASLRMSRAVLVVSAGFVVLLSWHQSAAGVIQTGYRNVMETQGVKLSSVDPATYRLTALAADRIRQLAGRSAVVFVTPDVGGVGLCCSRLRVIDIGLLTNATLAKQGYAAFPALLARKNPDVIGVHLMWASLSGIYDLPRFIADYQPALVQNTRLFVHKDVVDRMARRGTLTYCLVVDASCRHKVTRLHRYAAGTNSDDDRAFLRAGRVLLVESGR